LKKYFVPIGSPVGWGTPLDVVVTGVQGDPVRRTWAADTARADISTEKPTREQTMMAFFPFS
jgi:hypothetical protein